MDDAKLNRILLLMYDGKPWSEGNILFKGYTKADIQWLVDNGLIFHSGETSLKEKQYSITKLGKEVYRG